MSLLLFLEFLQTPLESAVPALETFQLTPEFLQARPSVSAWILSPETENSSTLPWKMSTVREKAPNCAGKHLICVTPTRNSLAGSSKSARKLRSKSYSAENIMFVEPRKCLAEA